MGEFRRNHVALRAARLVKPLAVEPCLRGGGISACAHSLAVEDNCSNDLLDGLYGLRLFLEFASGLI